MIEKLIELNNWFLAKEMTNPQITDSIINVFISVVLVLVLVLLLLVINLMIIKRKNYLFWVVLSFYKITIKMFEFMKILLYNKIGELNI